MTMELAGETPSHARMASEGPRATKKNATLIVGRGPVPRHPSRARPCRSGSPDPDLFVIRRSQTTDGETHIVTTEIAGDRPPRYGNIETGRALLPEDIETGRDLLPGTSLASKPGRRVNMSKTAGKPRCYFARRF